MNKATALGLLLAMSTGAASAQAAPKKGAPHKEAPKPAPAPVIVPGDDQTPTVTPKAVPVTTSENANTSETLQNGQDDRPWAAGVSPDRQASALKNFQAGNKELNNGLFENAIGYYQAALKDWEHPAVYYNLALALLKLDRPLEVYDSLQKAIKFGPAPLEKDKYEHAQEYILLVSQQIANVEITCKKPGAKVSVDGNEVFTVGPNGEGGFYKGRVRAGRHTFVAEKPGVNAEVSSPYIGPGEPFRAELNLYSVEELQRTRRRWDKTWIPYAVLGGAVLVAGIGAGMELSANSTYNDLDDKVARCNEDNGGGGCKAEDVKSMRDSGDTKKYIGYVGYGLAGGAVAAGLILLYLNREQTYQITADDYKKQLASKTTSATALQFTPMIAPDVAGAMITGGF